MADKKKKLSQIEFREKLIISNQITKNNIPSRSAVKAITFKSKAIFGHYCNSMLKNGSWKHKVQKINQHTNQKVELDGCYIFNLEGLELDWKLRTQKKETDELEKPRQDNETQKDIFLHVSALESSKLRVLKEEQTISYDIKEEKDKLQAINIKKK